MENIGLMIKPTTTIGHYKRYKKKQNNSITCKTFVSILSKQTILPGCEKVDQTMHYVLAFLAKPADIIV